MVCRPSTCRPRPQFRSHPLRKIPWRLSRPQKLRHRRRLRRVDNIVAVLDTALKRQAGGFSHLRALGADDATSHRGAASQSNLPREGIGKATPEELSSTVEGRVLLDAKANTDQESRRHGRGPKRGEMVPEFSEHGVEMASQRFLSDEARLQGTIKLIERWKAEMPSEQEMLPRDKYTVFNRYSKGYRKGVHKIPKWTRVSQRLNPPGF